MKNCRRVVAGLLVFVLVLGLVPVPTAQAQTAGAVADGARMVLTTAGAAKALAANQTIQRAISIARGLGYLSGPLTLGLVLLDVGLIAWDWWARQSTDTASQSALPSQYAGCWSPVGTYGYTLQGAMGRCGTTIVFFSETVTGPSPTCDTYLFPWAHSALSSGYSMVGYYTITRTTSSGYATPCVNTVSLGASESDGTLQARSALGSTAVTPPSDKNQAIVAGFNAAIAKLNSQVGVAPGTGGQAYPVGLSSGNTIANEIATLNAGKNLLTGGVVLTPMTDYTPGSGAGNSQGAAPLADPVENTAPALDLSPVTSAVSSMSAAITAAISASQAAVVSAVDSVAAAISASQTAVVAAVAAVATPIVAAISASQAAVVSAVNSVVSAVSGITSHVDQVKVAVDGVKSSVDSSAAADVARDQAATAEAAAAPSPAFVCSTCLRVTSWAALFSSLQAAASGAPIFALVSRLAWPGVGTVQRTWDVGSWQGHSFSVNLDAAGIGTAITVVRFVVVGGAVIVAYMIIFG